MHVMCGPVFYPSLNIARKRFPMALALLAPLTLASAVGVIVFALYALKHPKDIKGSCAFLLSRFVP